MAAIAACRPHPIALNSAAIPLHSAARLAEAIGVSRQSIHELLRGKRSVSPEMAIRFARLFGNSPEFWLGAQQAVDLWEAAESLRADVARIRPLRVA